MLVEILKVSEALLVYGPLGVICVLTIWLAVFKDRALTAERKSFLSKMETLATQHKSEMQALEERYITKSETWMTKYHELATSQDLTIKALKGLVDQLRS